MVFLHPTIERASKVRFNMGSKKFDKLLSKAGVANLALSCASSVDGLSDQRKERSDSNNFP